MNRSVVSVVLLPRKRDMDTVITCSYALNKAEHSLIRLDNRHLPHLSIAQFFAPAEEAAALWEEVSLFQRDNASVVSTGIGFTPERHGDRTWVEPGFLKSSWLADLQAKIMASAFAGRFELHGGTGRGDAYRPHMTIGLIEGKRSVAFEIGPLDVCTRPYERMQLAVGLNGEHFTYVKTLFD